MATITLTDLWVHRFSDLSDFQRFPIFGGFSSPFHRPGEVQTMANGRRRPITWSGAARTADLPLPAAEREQAAWLDDLAGQVVMVRTPGRPVGMLFYAVYYTVQLAERDGDELVDLVLPLEEVSRPE